MQMDVKVILANCSFGHAMAPGGGGRVSDPRFLEELQQGDALLVYLIAHLTNGCVLDYMLQAGHMAVANLSPNGA